MEQHNKIINKAEKNTINLSSFYQKNNKLDKIVENREQNIKQMLGFTNKKLDKNYKLVCQQMTIAFEQKNYKAFEILSEMESQLLECMVLKQQ